MIRYAVWLCHRLNVGHCDIEDLRAERGIEASYESGRLRCNRFGPPLFFQAPRAQTPRVWQHVLHRRGIRRDRRARAFKPWNQAVVA
jgi:hypothetical protein